MKRIIKIVARIFIIVLIVATLPYYYAVIYDFEKGQPFSGNNFYNPYSVHSSQWIKSNFHAHSKAMLGLTEGANSSEELLAKYDSLEYDLPCISNYNSIEQTGRNLHINDYEHGFNIGFTHQLKLNSKSAFAFDYPFFQFKSHKQFVLNKLKSDSSLVALAHPNFKSSYTNKDVVHLDNYDLIEGISVRSTSVDRWDDALSYGKPVWIIGNDDAHDTTDGHCGVCWTMVGINERSSEEVLTSLKAGRCYATRGWQGQEMNTIESVNISNNRYHLKLKAKADSIILKSDNGKRVDFTTNSDSILYEIDDSNTYIRAEVFETEPWNDYTRTYLNPVVRSPDGQRPPDSLGHEINWLQTILYYISVLSFHLLLAVTYKKLK